MSAMATCLRASTLSMLFACAVAAQAWGQTPPEEDVVVSAPEQSLQTEIRRFVRGHARLSRIDQLARWRDPICVRVLNLPTEFGDFIANRIRTVAREARAPVADGDCAPNISIVFTPEPQAVLDQVRADSPELLGAHFIGERDALARMTRPIQAWYVTGSANRYPTPDQFGGVETRVDEPMRDPPSGGIGSRLTNGLQSVFLHVLILVDQSQVAGAEIGPIADYLSVLALTEIRDESWGCGGLVTIMEHFSSCPDAPMTLTDADRGFLRGLYTMDEWSVGRLQQTHVRGRVSDALVEEDAGAEPTN